MLWPSLASSFTLRSFRSRSGAFWTAKCTPVWSSGNSPRPSTSSSGELKRLYEDVDHQADVRHDEDRLPQLRRYPKELHVHAVVDFQLTRSIHACRLLLTVRCPPASPTGRRRGPLVTGDLRCCPPALVVRVLIFPLLRQSVRVWSVLDVPVGLLILRDLRRRPRVNGRLYEFVVRHADVRHDDRHLPQLRFCPDVRSKMFHVVYPLSLSLHACRFLSCNSSTRRL